MSPAAGEQRDQEVISEFIIRRNDGSIREKRIINEEGVHVATHYFTVDGEEVPTLWEALTEDERDKFAEEFGDEWVQRMKHQVEDAHGTRDLQAVI